MTITDLIGPSIGGGLGVFIAVLGWVWQLSNRTAQLEYLDRRIDALEQAAISRGQRIDEIADRLSRIEPLISFAVDHLTKGSLLTTR